MKCDITRDTFAPEKDFLRVLEQQGRVRLDADWNEQVSILLNYLQTLTRDLVGPEAGPQGACGFEMVVGITELNALMTDLDAKEQAKITDIFNKEHVVIAPGRYYVDGCLARNTRFASFFHQAPALTFDPATLPQQSIAYLDVWEEHLTAIEDDAIREVALNGADTTTRTRIRWVVRARALTDEEKVLANPSTPTTKVNFLEWRESVRAKFSEWSEAERTRRGLLRAGIEEHPQSDDPCECSPESVYRGIENQLYRVEIHRGGPAWDGKSEAGRKSAATFKWSRENGSVVARWVGGEGEVLQIAGSHDRARGFAKGQWVELSDDRHELEGVPGTLVQLADAEAGSLTIDPGTTTAPYAFQNFPNTPKVRRWDQEETETIALTDGAIAIEHDKWFALEDGVQVWFPAPAAGAYEFRPGDYWMVPARVARADIEWPWDPDLKNTRRALPPHGIHHRHALLGFLTAGANQAFTFTDLRRQFTPLSDGA
jgi:Family of unknown function (DUF6519)